MKVILGRRSVGPSRFSLGACCRPFTISSHLQVVVLNSRPMALDSAPHRSAMELSMIIDEADQRRNVSGRGRKSSMVAWETTLEDVLEDEDAEDWEEEEESVMEGTVLEIGGEEEDENVDGEEKVRFSRCLEEDSCGMRLMSCTSSG